MGSDEARGAQGGPLIAAAAPAPRRIETLDVLRGVAVLGILLLNIVGFALPHAAYLNPLAYGSAPTADVATYLVNFVLFDGRMRGLFSFLFGASMLLVADRAEAAGRDPARVHHLRMGWLLVFGLAHLWLVWDGDILTHYALVGMIAFGLRDLPRARMVVLGVLLVALATLLAALVPLEVQALQAAQDPGAAARLALVEARFGTPPASELFREVALFRGDYAGILRDRWTHGSSQAALLLQVGPETLAYMLFGMAALRSGMLSGAWPQRRYRRWLAVTWGVALPVYLLLAVYLVGERFSLFSVALAVIAGPTPVRPVMILGWICLVVLTIRPGSAIAARIAAAGRMAFTNYLATSLICTSLFYGYGLGWFGSLTRWQLYPLVFAIWALILGWSKPWLARWRFGPFEWLWRSLARGAIQPMRGGAIAGHANASQ